MTPSMANCPRAKRHNIHRCNGFNLINISTVLMMEEEGTWLCGLDQDPGNSMRDPPSLITQTVASECDQSAARATLNACITKPSPPLVINQ